MPDASVITPETSGIDTRKNPIFLGRTMLHYAANVCFDEGRVKTRPGFLFNSLGIEAPFQGFSRFSPARGLSFKPFAPSIDSLAIAAGGHIYLYEPGFTCAQNICNPVRYDDEVNLFQAENYLIAQSKTADTTWYEGGTCFVRSPGIGAKEEIVKNCMCEVEVTERDMIGKKNFCCYERIRYKEFKAAIEEDDSAPNSHDSFIWEKHRNFLINGAGLGIYAHGRIHQEGPYSIYVSDIIHGRGNKQTDDILLMEEQMLASMGPPLSVTSEKGNLIALANMPRQGSANGEGEIVAYYENGVVSYDTFQFPRETRHDANGVAIQEGWDTKRMVSHLLNSITAVGRYAVAELPRDNLFRSRFGLHFLKISLGEGSFNDETTNVISAPVEPILSTDAPQLLYGGAVGHWVAGSRMVATTGLRVSDPYSVSPMGSAFVVWNQATTFTRDRTPISVWEGCWMPDNGIAGIHAFSGLGDRFGFICSDDGTGLHFATIEPGQLSDIRNGVEIPIEWEVITGAIVPTPARLGSPTLSNLSDINNGRIDAIMAPGSRIKVEIRTDQSPEWALWAEVAACDAETDSIVSESFEMPPKHHRQASWVQLRISGLGYCEIISVDVTYSDGTKKGGGRSSCRSGSKEPTKFFRLNHEPSDTRWP